MLQLGTPWRFERWRDDRLPEMLWAVIMRMRLGRGAFLDVARDVAQYGRKFEATAAKGGLDVTHSALAGMEPQDREEIIGIICSTPEKRQALRPLRLFPDIPAAEIWSKHLEHAQASDWLSLAAAVSRTLDHQSLESTDCRWARIIFAMLIGRMKFVGQPMLERAKQYYEYPNTGPADEVRAMLRASEHSLSGLKGFHSQWSPIFWEHCLRETRCIRPSRQGDVRLPWSVRGNFRPVLLRLRRGWQRRKTNQELLRRVDQLYQSLLAHSDHTRTTTGVDARHDTTFGTALYALAILRELVSTDSAGAAIARAGLRSLFEAHVTLTYLKHHDSADLWQSYRVFSAGQMKLAYLKLDEADVKPEYVSLDTLQDLANEDGWMEYATIDLGHWDKTNLRTMAQDVGVKADYDRFYPWTSSYVHAHWGAARDVIFDTCLNPLHRVHRIPRLAPRILEDAIPDACYLTDRVLDVVALAYPPFDLRLKRA